MFEQVSTYELDQLPALAAWATSVGMPPLKNASLLLFCLHTYYALIVKLLTVELVTISQRFTEESFIERLAHSTDSIEFRAGLEDLESGKAFKDLRILNFLEGDFFTWYLAHYNSDLENALREVINVFRGYEPATPKLSPARCRDLLKVFYTAIIDEQIRHDLGEFYTPDWLADLVLDRVGYEGELSASVLDPACGSGTFLVLAINRLVAKAKARDASPDRIVRDVLSRVWGFDLNPLAVISARANYLLALAEYLPQFGGDLEIPVYLSDCINIPKETLIDHTPCLVYTLETEIGNRIVALPISLVKQGDVGKVLRIAERNVRENHSTKLFLEELASEESIALHLDVNERQIIERFYSIIVELENREWDEIWCRIIKNHFAPQSAGSVRYVVGNPPWVRWSRLPVRYRSRCKEFCYRYGLVSGHGYTGGIESDISTVLTYSAADHWLEKGGILGFLITATVYKSDSARGFRRFELPDRTPLYPMHIDALTSLQPFPDATNETSLLVLRKGTKGDDPEKVYPPAGFPVVVWTRAKGVGRVDPRLSLKTVKTMTTTSQEQAVPIADRGSPLFIGTSNDVKAIKPFRGSSAYEAKAHKGTTTDLVAVYWVQGIIYNPDHERIKIRSLNPEQVGGARFGGVVTSSGIWLEADLVFPLIRGRNIGRFCFATDGWYIVVPNRHYEMTGDLHGFRLKYPLAYKYFENNRALLEKRSTYKRYQKTKPFFVIYDIGDYTFCRFKVVWMEQQDPKNFRACVIGESAQAISPNRLIIPDHKLYMLSLSREDEAHYVCGVLNSRHIRKILGGFLVGKQIGTTIFRYVHIPVFDSDDIRHKKISNISANAHEARAGERTTQDLPKDEQEELDFLVRELFPR